jgi:hypothetical protein
VGAIQLSSSLLLIWYTTGTFSIWIVELNNLLLTSDRTLDNVLTILLTY